MNFWTKKEFDIIIASIQDKLEYYTIYNLLYYTGIRIGELLALTLDDFNFKKKTLSITKSYWNGNPFLNNFYKECCNLYSTGLT